MLRTLEGIQKAFNDSDSSGKKKVSLADLIVLGGCAAVEQAAKLAGYEVKVPFAPGRTVAQEQTDQEAFAVLEPTADGFRDYVGNGHHVPAEVLLIERALMLTLSAPEMTVLVGGLRVLGANAGQFATGVFTSRPGTLTNDFFVNLLDMNTEWRPTSDAAETFDGNVRGNGHRTWTASRVDLIFGSNSELRALAEVYACDDAKGEVRAGFRGGVGQGHDPRSIRPRLIATVQGRPGPGRPSSLTTWQSRDSTRPLLSETSPPSDLSPGWGPERPREAARASARTAARRSETARPRS